MSDRPLVVIGDALLDRDVEGRVERLSPDAPVPVLDETAMRSRPGGAGLAAVLAAADGWTVTLVTALAQDAAGETLRTLLGEAGVDVVDLGLGGATPEKVRLRCGDRSLMRLDRGDRRGPVGPAPAAARAAIGWAAGVLVSDYGRGVAADPALRETLATAAGELPVVWDPHPRGPAPPPAISVVTPNEAEVLRVEPEPAGIGLAEATERAHALRRRWRAGAVCTTRGPAGALVVREGRAPFAAPAPLVAHGDPCGAGDRFASRLALRLAERLALEDAVVDAVARASTFVAAGGASDVLGKAAASMGELDLEGGLALADRVRAGGGTVVATGGCFDLLHAGHVRTLEAARRLGECLIVCLNSDASVRRLKGPERPLVPEADRASVLSALSCVDAVVPFDEDTPARALESLRPHVWVKGGDYRGASLPEERTLRRWGGRAVIVPYFEGRSTTRLIEEAADCV